MICMPGRLREWPDNLIWTSEPDDGDGYIWHG